VRLVSCVFLLQIPLALTVVRISRSDNDDNFMKNKSSFAVHKKHFMNSKLVKENLMSHIEQHHNIPEIQITVITRVPMCH
jgi:hypothetical protein